MAIEIDRWWPGKMAREQADYVCSVDLKLVAGALTTPGRHFIQWRIQNWIPPLMVPELLPALVL